MGWPGRIVGAMTVGAGLMYFLDPNQGRRRRALARDKASRLRSHYGPVMLKAGRDLRNRSAGTVAWLRSLRRRGGEPVTDQVIEARVRSEIGHFLSRPFSVSVSSEGGRVTVRGGVLRREADRLLDLIRSVPGVKEVYNRLDVHEELRDVPGAGTEAGHSGLAGWTPAARLLAGSAGGALAAYGLSRRDPVGGLTGLVGAGLLTTAIANKGLRRRFGR